MNYGRYGRELLLELKRGDDRSLDVSGDVDTASSSNRGGGGAAAPLVPPYNDELVMRCIDDVRLHALYLRDQAEATTQLSSQSSGKSSANDKSKDKVVDVPMHVRPNILLQSASFDRNKRCLLAYHVGRIQRIKPYYWNTMIPNATATTTSMLHDDANDRTTANDDDEGSNGGMHGRSAANTCPAEDDFLRDYGRLVQKYTLALGLRPDDLRAHGMSPPAPFDKVQVRVVSCPPLLGTGDVKDGSEKGNDGDENFDPSHKGGRGIVLDSGTSVVFSEGSTHYLLWDDVEEFVRLGYLQVLDGEEQQG